MASPSRGIQVCLCLFLPVSVFERIKELELDDIVITLDSSATLTLLSYQVRAVLNRRNLWIETEREEELLDELEKFEDLLNVEVSVQDIGTIGRCVALYEEFIRGWSVSKRCRCSEEATSVTSNVASGQTFYNDHSPHANELHRLTYPDIPHYFRWVSLSEGWKLRSNRQSTPSIGRLYSVHHTDRERFALKILLSNVILPTSFQDLRTFDGVVYTSNIEAAVARGLLRGDREYELILEPALHLSARSLRELFAILVQFSEVLDVKELFSKFQDALSADLVMPPRK